MATIVKKKRKSKATYYVVYRNFDGKQIWKLAGDRKIDAEHLKAKIETELHSGTYQEMPDVGFKEFLEKWHKAKEPDVRPKTLASYKGHINNHILPYFGNRKLKSITTSDIETFKSFLFGLNIKPTTMAKALIVVKMALKTAVIWGYIARNPAEYVKRPRSDKYEPLFLTPDQLKHLVKSTPEKHKALIATACFTGMRQGELLGLKWDDVDFVSRRLFVQRTLQQGKFYNPKAYASRRSIDVPSFLLEMLKNHQLNQMVGLSTNEHNLVFPNEAGSPMDCMNLINRIFKPVLKLADLPLRLRFHDLRHSYASMLIHQDANIKYVQKQLGHANVQMTLNIYSHLLPDAGQETINKMESLFEDKTKEISPVSV